MQVETEGFVPGDDFPAETTFEEPMTDATAEVQPSSQKVVIDGKEVSVEDVVRMRAEATKAYQEASAMKKEVEPWLQVDQAWKSGDPTARRMIVQTMAEAQGITLAQANAQANQQFGATQTAQPENWDEWTTNERSLYLQNQNLQQKMEAQAKMTQELHQAFTQTSQQQQREYAINAAVGELATKNIKTTPDQVRQAMNTTGIQDPIGAFAKANLDGLIGQAVTAGHQQGAQFKPEGQVNSQTKTFNPNDPKLVARPDYADYLIKLLEKGYTPVE